MELERKFELLHDFSPRIRVYKDGTVERLVKDDKLSALYDLKTRVHSKDVTISQGLSARIYRPDIVDEDDKLPLLIYIHGGAFCLYSASSSIYHNYLNSLVSISNIIAISVDYRLAPEHPIPTCYDDSWAVIQWVESHAGRAGPDPWLNGSGDFNRVYFGGDSAGANIAHEMVIRAGSTGLIGPSTRVAGLALVHPFFGEDWENPLWEFLCPSTTGESDPRLNPASDIPRLRRELGCERVLVCVGEKDFLRGRGHKYYEVLREESEWKGEVEFMESKGKGHVFHLYKPDCIESMELLRCVANFIGKEIKGNRSIHKSISPLELLSE